MVSHPKKRRLPRYAFRVLTYLYVYTVYHLAKSVNLIGPPTADELIARAKRRALEHELHILILWLSRAKSGWRLHRSIEDFFAALEESYSGKKDSLSKIFIEALPKKETPELAAAIINRAALGGATKLIVQIMTWSVPTILLYLEVSGLETHNNILSREVENQAAVGIEARDIQYLRILACSPSCEPSTVRARALNVYLRDQRLSNPSNRLVLSDIDLSNMTVSGLDLSNLDFQHSETDNARFNNVNFQNSSFDLTSSLQNTKFEMSNFANFKVEEANLKGVEFTSSCLKDAEIYTGVSGPLSYNSFSGSDLSGFSTNNLEFNKGLGAYQSSQAASWSHAPPNAQISHLCFKTYPHAEQPK